MFLRVLPLFFVFIWTGHSSAYKIDKYRIIVTIENITEEPKEIFIRIRSRATSGDWSGNYSDWVTYRIDSKETVEIICTKCEYYNHRFELAIDLERPWTHHVLVSNKFYVLKYNKYLNLDLYYHKVESVYYIDRLPGQNQ